MKDIVTELRGWQKLGTDSSIGRAADEIERLRKDLGEAHIEMTRLAQRNTVLVSEIDTAREVMLRQDNEMSNLRQRNSDLRDRNTRLLSQIQEMEVREQ